MHRTYEKLPYTPNEGAAAYHNYILIIDEDTRRSGTHDADSDITRTAFILTVRQIISLVPLPL